MEIEEKSRKGSYPTKGFINETPTVWATHQVAPTPISDSINRAPTFLGLMDKMGGWVRMWVR